MYPAASRTRLDVHNVSLPEESGSQMFMTYVPDKNMVLCACAKCGSTAFFKYFYQLEMGKPWEYGDTRPYAQDTGSARWQERIVHINDTAKQEQIMKTAYSFALIRDPKERIISAWKSKIACDESYGG